MYAILEASKPLNERTVTAKLTRIELCDLLLACLKCSQAVDAPDNKWDRLHEKILGIIDDFDAKQTDIFGK